MGAGLQLVLLAAGASRRLGSPKALVELQPPAVDAAGDAPQASADGRESTPLARLLAAARPLADPRPLVVSGADHEAIARAARRQDAELEVVHNPDWEAGRTGGVALAARLRPGRDLCLAPVDVPLVPAAVFEALDAAWSQAGAPAEGWLAPFVRRDGAPRFGHPVVLGRGLARRLERLSPAEPLRVLREHAAPLLAVEVASAAILDDLDTPLDLRRLRGRLAGGP